MVPKFLSLLLIGVVSLSFSCANLFAQEKSLDLFGGNKDAKGPTVVTASESADFDSHSHVAVFVGTVEVQDPQFSMTCDKLTVQLNKTEGGIKQADAEGNVIIVSVKKDPNGGPDDKSVGRGEKAVYTPADGRIALSGTPQIQQGTNTHIATSPTTKMYIWQDGRMKTDGPSRTIMTPAKKGDNKAK